MIDELDLSLAELLKRELRARLAGPVDITFNVPNAAFPGDSVTLPAVNLFLYAVRENRELRKGDWERTTTAEGSLARRRPPVRVDCSYLITAWTDESAPAIEEHRLLSNVMAALLRHSVLPRSILTEPLAKQEAPILAATLNPSSPAGGQDLWLALGGRPRASISYTVTIGIDVAQEVDLGPPVLEKVLVFKEEAR